MVKAQQIVERMKAHDGRSVEPFRRIAAELEESTTSIHEMLDLAHRHPEPAVEVGATWIVKDLLERAVRAPDDLAERVVGLLAEVRAADARLHLLQTLPYATLTPELARRLEPRLRPMLEEDSTFVRAWAHNALGLVAEAEPALRELVLGHWDRAEASEKASVRVRIRKARQRLSKVTVALEKP